MPSETTAVPADVVEQIQEKLEEIERTHEVRILFAVESGSRAWGFPSPDSDFDVRFVYVHRPDWYLSIDPRRDVIEIPIEGDLDISGWDLKKALQLLVKPNPVLLEWLRSPIVYRADRPAMHEITVLGERTNHIRPSTYHYLRLAESQYRRFIQDKNLVPLKKYFYSLRPALALLWIRTHPDEPVPMALSALLNGVTLPREATAFIEDMLKRKAQSKELGNGPRVAALDGLIEREIKLSQSMLGALPPVDHEILDAANVLFRKIIG